jgi:glycosyltransferase involved in cell wall biosynthesis
VDDCSTQKEYSEYDFTTNGVIVIHLEPNSKKIHGYACPGGYQRNFGISVATGKYIAFCDDDDIWFPHKLELQIAHMKATGCKMSSTETLIGYGPFSPTSAYKMYNADQALLYIQLKYRKSGAYDKDFLLDGKLPTVWNLKFLQINNCCICSSVVIERSIIDMVGSFKSMPTADDYEYWLRVLEHTDCVYVSIPCVYYDAGHGDGQNYTGVV